MRTAFVSYAEVLRILLRPGMTVAVCVRQVINGKRVIYAKDVIYAGDVI